MDFEDMTVTHPPIHKLHMELLIYIFRISTAPRSPITFRYMSSRSPRYRPFQNTRRNLFVIPEERTIWQTKLALPLVCKFWRECSNSLLYEDVYVGYHCSSLTGAFERSEAAFPGYGLGRHVRSLTLCQNDPSLGVIRLSDILKWCPNVSFIAKDDTDVTPLGHIEDAKLEHIERFDWNYAADHFKRLYESLSRAHGRDFFRDLVFRASNLRYLHIGIMHPNSRFSKHTFPPITLPSLETLHVIHIGHVLRAELETWMYPKLKHIITDSSLLDGSDGISPLFGSQIKIIELLRDESLSGIASGEDLFRLCPDLKEINYYAEYSPFHFSSCHDKVESVGLCSRRNNMLGSQKDSEIYLIQQLSLLVNTDSFPSLKHIVLYGPHWKDSEYLKAVEACAQMHTRGCIIEDELGEVLLNTS